MAIDFSKLDSAISGKQIPKGNPVKSTGIDFGGLDNEIVKSKTAKPKSDTIREPNLATREERLFYRTNVLPGERRQTSTGGPSVSITTPQTATTKTTGSDIPGYAGQSMSNRERTPVIRPQTKAELEKGLTPEEVELNSKLDTSIIAEQMARQIAPLINELGQKPSPLLRGLQKTATSRPMYIPMLMAGGAAALPAIVVFETYTQAKNAIATAIKKEKFNAIEVKFLSDLLPDSSGLVKTGAQGVEMLADIALTGGVMNGLRGGLNRQALQNIMAKAEKAGYRADLSPEQRSEIAKKAASEGTLGTSISNFYRSLLLKIKPIPKVEQVKGELTVGETAVPQSKIQQSIARIAPEAPQMPQVALKPVEAPVVSPKLSPVVGQARPITSEPAPNTTISGQKPPLVIGEVIKNPKVKLPFEQVQDRAETIVRKVVNQQTRGSLSPEEVESEVSDLMFGIRQKYGEFDPAKTNKPDPLGTWVAGQAQAIRNINRNKGVRVSQEAGEVPQDLTTKEPTIEEQLIREQEVANNPNIAKAKDIIEVIHASNDFRIAKTAIKQKLGVDLSDTDAKRIFKQFKQVNPPQNDLHLNENSTEAEFLDETPSIGLRLGDVVPKTIPVGGVDVPIDVDRGPKYFARGNFLKVLHDNLRRFYSPVRHIVEGNPYAEKIARMGRDVAGTMGAEIETYLTPVHNLEKGLNDAQKQAVIDELQSPVKGQIPLNEKQIAYHDALRQVYDAMYKQAEQYRLADVGSWKIPTEQYFPHIFVGSYQVKANGKTIGFAKNLRDAVNMAKQYGIENPEIGKMGNFAISPKEIFQDFVPTMLTRGSYQRLVNDIENATQLSDEEVRSMMRGVARIKPKAKYVGNFQQRVVNLGSYIKDPTIATRIYVTRIMRKKWLDMFNRRSQDWLNQIEDPAMRSYMEEYIGVLVGKYDPFNHNFTLTKTLDKINALQTKLKLGYRPSTALINLTQPARTAYAEIGNYMFRGYVFMNTAKGKEIIRLSGVEAQPAKYTTQEFQQDKPKNIFSPMTMFSGGENINRKSVVAGGYLFAKKIFQLTPEQAHSRGLDYVYAYKTMFSKLEQYQKMIYGNLSAEEIGAIEYAKDLNADTNYVYDKSDAPRMMATHPGADIFKFKGYQINFLLQSAKWYREALRKPTPHNIARAIRFTATNLLIGGIKLPLRVASLAMPRNWYKVIILAMVGSIISEQDPKKKSVKNAIWNGVASLAGIDTSRRMAIDMSVPEKIEDAFGVTISDVVKIYRLAQQGASPDKYASQLFLGAKDVIGWARNITRGGIYMPSGEKRINASPLDIWILATGFTPNKIGLQMDIEEWARLDKLSADEQRSIYYDRMAERITEGKEFSDITNEAALNGVRLTEQGITNAVIKRKVERPTRAIQRAPSSQKKTLKEMIDALGN